MATYVTLINFTAKGVPHVKDTANRASRYKELAAKLGCTVKENYWTQGQYNVVSIVDAPDEASTIALHVDSEGRPIMPSTPTGAKLLPSDDAMRFDPHAYTFKGVGELHMESARREEKFPTHSEMEKAVERAKNVDGNKQGLSPAELYADGPMS
jgi:uncharacterized protein with GYD domain